MTEIARDRSWWADVEHLRPGAEKPANAPAPRPSLMEPAREERAQTVDAEEAPRRPDADVRRGRITGRPLPERAQAKPATLRRADAAAFADAMDLDGAFGAPAAALRSREIVLGRSSSSRHDGHAHPSDWDRRPSVSAQDHDGEERPTVRISGNPALHELADRRSLREIEPRRTQAVEQHVTYRPDRIVMYVVLLGVFLVLIAATSSAGVS